MSEYAIAARLATGNRVAIDTMLKDRDYNGVVNTSFLDAEAAIRFGEAVAAMGRAALASDQNSHSR